LAETHLIDELEDMVIDEEVNTVEEEVEIDELEEDVGSPEDTSEFCSLAAA
jgi:hypothetical protein